MFFDVFWKSFLRTHLHTIRHLFSFIICYFWDQSEVKMRVNRRTFINLALTITIGLFVALWNKMTLTQKNQNKRRKLTYPFDRNKQVTFLEDFVIINSANETQVFLAHCTHLGCKINQIVNGKLVCPCHGSEYNLKGQVLKGPAYKNLQALHSVISEDGNHIEIES